MHQVPNPAEAHTAAARALAVQHTNTMVGIATVDPWFFELQSNQRIADSV